MLSVNEAQVFRPEQTPGLIFLSTLVVLFSGLGVWGLWNVSLADIGPRFLLFLLPALVAFGFVPFITYRAVALRSATYQLQRDGVSLHWGLRTEDIPMDAIIWAGRAEDLQTRLPLPVLRLPGAVVGNRIMSGVGNVEFMAANTRDLFLIVTAHGGFAISPEGSAAFQSAFQRLVELGSLSPLPARSVYPTFLFARVWREPLARYLILGGMLLSLILLVWTSLAIPVRATIFLGFDPNGLPGDQVPAVRLLLLPVLSAFFFLADLLLGLFFFRRPATQPVAYIFWVSGIVIPVMFLIGVVFILRSG